MSALLLLSSSAAPVGPAIALEAFVTNLFDFWERAFLNAAVGRETFTPPASLYIGLSHTTPADDGTSINEPSGGGYAPVQVLNDATHWGPPLVVGMAMKSNALPITFATATADWLAGEDLLFVVVYDALVAGHALAYGRLLEPRPVYTGGQASFAPGALVWAFD